MDRKLLFALTRKVVGFWGGHDFKPIYGVVYIAQNFHGITFIDENKSSFFYFGMDSLAISNLIT